MKWDKEKIKTGLLGAVGGAILLAVIASGFAIWGLTRWGLGASGRRRFVYHIPLIGPALRWAALARFSDLLALLIENQVPLPEALKLAGDGSHDAQIREASHKIAQRTEAGEPLRQAAREFGRFPASFLHTLSWEDHETALPDSLHAAADMFESRARVQSRLIGTVCEPFVVVLTWLVVGFTVIALFMPLIRLLNDLS